MSVVNDTSSALVDTEARVLSIAFLTPDAAFHAEELGLRGHHFWSTRHAVIWDAVRALYIEHGNFDATTVRAHLDRSGKLDDAGGDEMLQTIAHGPVIAAGNLRQYVELVIDAARRRTVSRICQATLERIQGPDSTEHVVSALEKELLDLAKQRERGGYRHIADILDGEQERLHALSNGEIITTGMKTGFKPLDDLCGGMRPGQLIVVGARPAQGKSAFVTGIAEHAAVTGHAVLLHSLEMADSEIAERLMSARTGIAAERLRRGEVRPDKWGGIMASNSQLALAPLRIDDTSDLSISDVRARARRHAARHPVDLVIVDYLQLLRVIPGENRVAAVGEMSRGLKILARELECPVIALSQLNRKLEDRTNKTPVLSDLRESGQIEQDADQVWFLHREESYDPDTERTGVADVIVAKNRGGRTGTVELAFDGPTMSFKVPAPKREHA